MNLTRVNWPKGWLPSNDAVNGDPEGLLRADNLTFDKAGVVSLCDGAQAISAAFSDFVSEMYSKVVEGREYIWAATGVPVTAITRFVGPGIGIGTPLVINGGGSPSGHAAFGDAFGYTLAVAGPMRVKDQCLLGFFGSNPGIKPLGLLTPNPPIIIVNNQVTVTVPTPDDAFEGTGSAGTLTLDPATNEGQLCSSSSLGIDTINIGGSKANDSGLDSISFPFAVTDQPSSVLTSIEVDFLLNGTPNDPSTYSDYYALKFSPTQIDEQFPFGLGTNATMVFKRVNCSRYGTDQTLDWSNIIGVRLLVQASTACTIKFGDIVFAGGSKSGLNGTYNYIQVDVANDGRYLAKSPVSPLGADLNGNKGILLLNGSVRINPVIRDPNTTEHWFFRKAETDVIDVNPVTGTPQQNTFLNQFYFVGKSDVGQHFDDVLDDIAILQINADGGLLPNLFLHTLNSNDTVNGVQDYIYGIEGIFNERMLYMGLSFVYLSDRLNPDAIDTRFTLRPSGDTSEKNLWIKKLTNNVLILATTKNLYEITGTLLEQPDGTIDVRLIPIGEAFPPLSTDVCNFNGGLYYVAADGLRVTTGSNSVNVSPQLRHLFQNVVVNNQIGTVMRHGVPGVAVYDGVGVDYSVAAAKGKIYFVVPCQDATRRVFIYDTINKIYENRYTDPVKLYATQAGEVLAAYGSGSNNRIFVLDSVPGVGIQQDGTGLQFKLRTVFDPNGQPRNRKDVFTLKLVFDSGGDPISVDIQRDGIGVTETDENTWINLGQNYSANGQKTIYIAIGDGIDPRQTLGFRYSVQISSTLAGVKKFKLYEMSIEYEPRPEQLNYLRVLPTNMGTISRKRWTAFAFVIDTLGNDVLFNPLLDNVNWIQDASQVPVVNTSGKQTFIYYFTSEAIATDMGILLVSKDGEPARFGPNGGPFEFYGVDLSECISEKLPPPVEFLIIPPDNYGTPNRKRHTSYKFQILTRGKNVKFTPNLDGVAYSPAIYNTITKRTVEYFFDQSAGDVIGIDIGGTLQTIETTPFEYYGNVKPQTVEVLPDRLEYLRIPNSNFNVASRKRVRTLPLVIDTYGKDVQFTPIVDGVLGLPETLNTKGKVTTYYYFINDSFGTDYGGILSGGNIFEFYGMLRPEDVEILPVPKLLDQLGPVRLDKIGKLFSFRLRVIPTTTTIPWAIYDDYNQSGLAYATPLANGTIQTFPNVDEIYEIPMAKNVNAAVMRLVLGPTTNPFYRYDVALKVQTSGMETGSKWLPIR